MLSRSLRFSLIAAAAALLGATPAASVPAPIQYVAPNGSGALFVISGHGWGHGVGMGQWGAQGYALQGYTYDQILAAYYPGTALGQTTVTKIRVLLADGKKSMTVSSDQAITVVDGGGATHTLAAGSTKLTPALDLAVDGGSPQQLEPPLTLSPKTGSSLTLGRAYRGKLVIDVVDGKLRAINVLPLEQYLYGVVPAEMPSTWLPDALAAQAVAARSYAVATRRTAAPFDLYADSRSQAYLGISVETPAATAAVQATAGQVLLYAGHVATTFFSSSTGGWTQSAADAWGQSVPYLVSVRDPYDGISPYHNWGPVPVTGQALAEKLGVSGQVVDATVKRNPSRRVAQLVVAALTDGVEGSTSVAGSAATAQLGLRSSWFSVGVLSLLAPQPNPAVTYGTTVQLTGVVRGLKGVVVEDRTHVQPWTQLDSVTPAVGTGAISVSVKPTLTTDYRLATPGDAAAYVRIRLTPRVVVATASRTSVTGRERPALSGARVLVEQQLAGSTAWTIVARATVGTGGLFSASASLQPGGVRVVVAPGNGWWPGASNPATVG